jgi:hypothetical protein
MASHDDDRNGWVDERLRSLDGARGTPTDAGQARARLRERHEATGRASRRRTWTLAAAAVVLAVLSLPWPRAAAQRLLDRLTLDHIAVIDTARTDLPGSVTDALVMKPQPWEEESVRDLDEARRIVGFQPSLPPSDVLAGTPRLSVIRKATLATAPLKVAEIEHALAIAGVRDVTVPKEWEGTALSAEGGPAVLADYGDMQVIQSRPFRLTTAAGFPFGRFMELTFRVFGRPEDEARRLGQQLAENPALVMHFPGASAVRDVRLRTGLGVLVGNPDGDDGMCFFWSTPDRIYIIEADKLSESRAVAVADSIEEALGKN